MPKPFPPATGAKLFVPDAEHAYFAQNARHPLRTAATGFELVNAWWLAESALLAYADNKPGALNASEQFARAGLRLEGDQPFSSGSTQYYVARNDQVIIVAFRGTEFRRPGELTTR
ncbi:MAG: hypothetical protein ACKV2V_27340, partial [Blastocatellia bacterium]